MTGPKYVRTPALLFPNERCEPGLSKRGSWTSFWSMMGGRRLAAIVFAAVCFGVVMAVVKGQGAGARDALGNVSAPWLLVAFLGGASSRRSRLAPIAGLGVTVAALVGFYVAESRVLDLGQHSWLVDLQLTLRAGGVYLLSALLSGPIFGALGGVWARRRSAMAAAAVAVMFACEPLAVWLYQDERGAGGAGVLTHYPWLWGGEVLLGVAAATVLLGRYRRRLRLPAN